MPFLTGLTRSAIVGAQRATSIRSGTGHGHFDHDADCTRMVRQKTIHDMSDLAGVTAKEK